MDEELEEPGAIEAPAPALEQAAFRDARYVSDTAVDIELEHPRLGWIPMTITETDYPELWAEVVASDPAPYIPPALPTDEELRAVWRTNAVLTRREFCIALYRNGILPLDEALDAAKGNWPISFAPLLGMIPDPAEAQITWATVYVVERQHPFFEMVRAFYQMTPEQADAMFGYPPLD